MDATEIADAIMEVRNRWLVLQRDDRCADLYSEGGLDAIDEVTKVLARKRAEELGSE